jgi:4-methyl-5(b-hydroxyethyl)-thiazole monophosphate biosynthesis
MKLAVLFADGFEEVEAVTSLDFLRRAGIQTASAGLGGREIIGGHDIRVTTDVTVQELEGDLDGVVLPGGMPGAEHLRDSPDVRKLVRSLFEDGKLIAAICAAPGVVLGSYGILSGKRFTCYPGFEKHVKDGTFLEDPVVRDGSIITSRGPGTAARFAVEVIRYMKGDQPADEVFRKTLQK